MSPIPAPDALLPCLFATGGYALGVTLHRLTPSLLTAEVGHNDPHSPDGLGRSRERRWCGIACALVHLALCLRHGLTPETLEYALLASTLLTAVLADLWARRIPNGCIASAVIIRALYLALRALSCAAGSIADIRASLVGALVVGSVTLAVALLADRLLGRPSIGGGDIKLFAVGGLYFGWVGGLLVVSLSCALGLLLMLCVPSMRDAGNAFALGPGIALAFLILMLVGDPLAPWCALPPG